MEPKSSLVHTLITANIVDIHRNWTCRAWFKVVASACDSVSCSLKVIWVLGVGRWWISSIRNEGARRCKSSWPLLHLQAVPKWRLFWTITKEERCALSSMLFSSRRFLSTMFGWWPSGVRRRIIFELLSKPTTTPIFNSWAPHTISSTTEGSNWHCRYFESLPNRRILELSLKSTSPLVGSLCYIQQIPCLVSFWCMLGGSVEVWTKNNQYRVIDRQTRSKFLNFEYYLCGCITCRMKFYYFCIQTNQWKTVGGQITGKTSIALKGDFSVFN